MDKRRTDLAVEAAQLWREGGGAGELQGVTQQESLREGYPVTTVRVLDQEPGPDMRCRQIMQLMPYFYHAADSVADSNVQQELWKIGGQICRCLR